MKAGIWTGTCVAIALAATIGLVAQGGTTEISFFGCIQKADPPPAGGSAGAFVASNVTSVTVPARYAEGSITRIYRLEGDAAKISPHVGHQVSITGTLAAAPNSDRPSVGTDKPAPAPTAATAPIVKVTTLVMRSATCS